MEYCCARALVNFALSRRLNGAELNCALQNRTLPTFFRCHLPRPWVLPSIETRFFSFTLFALGQNGFGN